MIDGFVRLLLFQKVPWESWKQWKTSLVRVITLVCTDNSMLRFKFRFRQNKKQAMIWSSGTVSQHLKDKFWRFGFSEASPRATWSVIYVYFCDVDFVALVKRHNRTCCEPRGRFRQGQFYHNRLRITSLRRSSSDHSIDAARPLLRSGTGGRYWSIYAADRRPGCSKPAARRCCCRSTGQTDRRTPCRYVDAYR